MGNTPEYDFLPKLVPCPVCKGLNAEDADRCGHCRTDIKTHFERIKVIEDERKAEDDKEKAKQESIRTYTIIGLVILAFLVVGCIVNANTPPPKQYYFDAGTQSATPGAYTFQAGGKVKLAYSCSLQSGKTATAELSLVDMKTSKTVWSKQVKCVTGDYDHPIPEYTDTVQLESSNYDIGINMSGDASWDMKVTQA